MINKAILVGRLGKDPEVRYLQDGTAVVSMSLATDESWKDKNGERKKKTEWHRVVVFGKLADICAEFLNKGSLVYIEGKIQTRSWEDKDGNKRSTTEIRADAMKMLDGKKDSGKSVGRGRDEDVPMSVEGDDQIPF